MVTSHWAPLRRPWFRLCKQIVCSHLFKRYKVFQLGVCLGLAAAAQKNFVCSKTRHEPQVGDHVEGLPEFSAAQVAAHDNPENGIWVIYRNGVYDITDFIAKHPGGGEKIILAAGAYVEPFWQYYQQHLQPGIQGMLEDMRIGNVKAEDVFPQSTLVDPYTRDPQRPDLLNAHTTKPFNAETPSPLLVENFLTPNDAFFIRNHMPVPNIDAKDYVLEVEGLGVQKPLALTFEQLKEEFPKHCTNVTISCAGNRRHDMQEYAQAKGLDWGPGAISTAEWCGAKLADVLHAAALDISKGARHAQFESFDVDVEGNCYNVSIPIHTAISPDHDVLLAYEMNGEPIPPDHGYPVRAVVPGTTGTRSAKWLSRVVISDEEAEGHFQKKDYKVWPPSMQFGDMPVQDAPAIQEMPVQSAICSPVPNSTIPKDTQCISVKGYAYSGGGRDIARVEVSGDGGHTWHIATLLPRPPPKVSSQQSTLHPYEWSWVQWSATVPIPPNSNEADLCCRAVDSNYNRQPESPASIWNMRGLLTNSWHHVKVKKAEDDEL